MTFEARVRKIKAMPDGSEKLRAVLLLSTKIGIFDKRVLADEMRRLMDLGIQAFPNIK